MRKIILIEKIVALLGFVAVVAAVGYTNGVFFDQETAGAGFDAGSLDLNLSKNGGSADVVWTAADFLPGDEVEGEIDLDNSGTVPIKSILFSADQPVQ